MSNGEQRAFQEWIIDQLMMHQGEGVISAEQRQVERVGEALTAFVSDIASRTRGVSLTDFRKIPSLLAFRQELDALLREFQAGFLWEQEPEEEPEDELKVICGEIEGELAKRKTETAHETMRALGQSIGRDDGLETILTFMEAACGGATATKAAMLLLGDLVEYMNKDPAFTGEGAAGEILRVSQLLAELACRLDPEGSSALERGQADLRDLFPSTREEKDDKPRTCQAVD